MDMLSCLMRIAEAQSLHQRILTQRVAHRQAEHQLAVLLAELADRRLFAELGYASVGEYGVEVLDLPKRTTRDLVRIGRRLDDLPALAAALSAGELDWTKAREVVSIATPETAAAWVARALTVSSRILEREVAHAKVGEPPPAEGVAPERRPERVRIVLEMQASDAEVLYQAIALCRAQSDLDGEEVDDGALLAMIANNYVHAAGAREDTPTGERYRIVVHQCPDCGHAESRAEPATGVHGGHPTPCGGVAESQAISSFVSGGTVGTLVKMTSPTPSREHVYLACADPGVTRSIQYTNPLPGL